MKKILAALILSIMIQNIACANAILNDKQAFKLMSLIQFDVNPAQVNINDFKINIKAPLGGNGDGRLDSNLYYVYNYPFNEAPAYYIGVRGISISFTNDTSNVATIEWRKSAISVNGQVYGIPFLETMHYKDAGNPAFTPDTIIPPKHTAIVNASLPTMTTSSNSKYWDYHPAPLPRNGFLTFSLYLNVTVNGKTSYISLETPQIYISQTSYSAIVLKKK